MGFFPFGVSFNPNNGIIYLTNGFSDTIYVMAPLTTIFSEGCNGTIDTAGQAASCTITNAYGKPQTFFVCAKSTPDSPLPGYLNDSNKSSTQFIPNLYHRPLQAKFVLEGH